MRMNHKTGSSPKFRGVGPDLYSLRDSYLLVTDLSVPHILFYSLHDTL